jgi:protein ImuB
MRLACLHVPRFPLAAWLRAEPELCGVPLAITAGKGARARVVTVSPEAAQSGVSVGCNAAQAAAMEAVLVFRPASVDAESAAQGALCDIAHSFSPRVEDASGGTVYLDCEGLQPLYSAEKDLARSLVGAAMRLGLEIYVGIASSRIVAQLAAREGGGITIVPREEECCFLASLPVEVLDPDPPIRERLARWGIRTLGDLAALPTSALTARLGPEGARLARRARGEEEHPLVTRPAPLRFQEAVDLDYGIETLEALGFVLRALLDRLTARLTLRGFVCGDLHLALRLSNRARDERTVTVAVPGNDVKALLALVRLQLEGQPPTAPVEAIRLAVDPEQLRAAQLDLFRPNGPAPRRLAVTLARLAALCGKERVGFPAVVDSHRPDEYGEIAEFRIQNPESRSWKSEVRSRETEFRSQESGARSQKRGFTEQSSSLNPHASFLALRAIRPPCPLEVFMDHGRPDFVRPRAVFNASRSSVSKRLASDHGCTGRVVTAAGPWRVEGSWWNEAAFSRDYYDVQLSDGVVYRLYCETGCQAWFVDGVYD